MYTNIIISTYAAQEAGTVPSNLSGAVKPWKEFCHNKALRRSSFYVDFESGRNVGRWGYEKRKRPFVVRSAYDLQVWTSAKTLDGAIAAAQRLIDAV
jgi:hypothetical protein